MIKDSEFSALIRLLDDSDAEVRQIAEHKLSSLGPEIIPRLESAADEVGDLSLRNQVLGLVAEMQTGSISAELLTWRKGGGESLLKGWTLMSPIHHQTMSEKSVQDEISRLSNKIWLEINDQMYLQEKLRVFNHVFFVHENYQLEKEKPEQPELCFIDHLLTHKTGNSQSLNLLYLIIANRLELPLSGVILPGYSVLYCHEERQPFYLDVAGGGNFVTREGLELFVRKLQVQEQSAFYKPTSNIFLMLNLLEVLRRSYYAAGKMKKGAQVEDILRRIEIRLE